MKFERTNALHSHEEVLVKLSPTSLKELVGVILILALYFDAIAIPKRKYNSKVCDS